MGPGNGSKRPPGGSFGKKTSGQRASGGLISGPPPRPPYEARGVSSGGADEGRPTSIAHSHSACGYLPRRSTGPRRVLKLSRCTLGFTRSSMFAVGRP